MANNTYVVEVAVLEGGSATITDDGTGLDWLVLSGIHIGNSMTLDYTYDIDNVPTSASAIYYGVGTTTRLTVNGIIENARGANGADYIAGNSLGNVLFGDALATGAGGNDTIDGAEGNDTIFGGSGDDNLGGSYGNDRLSGGTGNDTLIGGLGIDTIDGGAGADWVNGSADAGDTLSYAVSTAGVRVTFTYGTTTTGAGGHAQGDQINGFSNLVGSAYADILTDSNAGTIAFGYNDNRFDAGAGNDRLTLGGGNDTGIGGAGNDTILGGEGNDLIGGGTDNDVIQGNVGIDQLFGSLGNDNLDGGDGNDVLDGGDGHDTMNGAAGNDTLSAGLGTDRLAGGLGADRFIFTSVGHSNGPGGLDTIVDFRHAQGDRIDLSGIDANGAIAGNAAFTFLGTGTFTGAGAELRVAATASGWNVIADINGDQRPDFLVMLTGAAIPALVAGDFWL